ncbi:MAG: UDP-N-acetylmuramoyl-tripeptide--D-alanyl-D-alanine ligase, partial [Acidobacteria bacterium]|nr:UDP-N-acetylmuramoyl-tripeptide--D-alanyl-D-alanine ligase [Acidobacteriota bacterium]
IPQAFENGALAAVAHRERVAESQALKAFSDRLLLVDDRIVALQTLAHKVYEQWARPVIAITGSAGKTTAKELTAHILKASGRRVLKSERNYNNGLGLPLSVLQMVSEGHTPEDFDVAVLEMGMSSPMHEIARLCKITPPDIGVELLVAPVHLEHLGTIENIAAAKAELIEGLKATGTAVLNADDELVMQMRSKHAGAALTFGIEKGADVTATEIEAGRFGRSRFRLNTPRGSAEAELPLPGRHNLMNALAASAVASCFEIEPQQIAEALRTVPPAKMRGEVLDFAAGFEVIDDSYNSNPRSLLSMVRTVQEGGGHATRRIVVAGEMLELGVEAARMHREVGREIASSGVEVLWGVRGLARELLEGAREGGMSESSLRFFEDSEEAAAALPLEIREGDLVLIKGSRGVQTDKIVKRLRESFPTVGADERAV